MVERVFGNGAPLNQHRAKLGREGEARLLGRNNKAYRAEQKRSQEAQFVRDWINRQTKLSMDPKQRFKLALRSGNNRDVEFLFDNIDNIGKFGYRADTYTFPAKDQVEPEKAESTFAVGAKPTPAQKFEIAIGT